MSMDRIGTTSVKSDIDASESWNDGTQTYVLECFIEGVLAGHRRQRHCTKLSGRRDIKPNGCSDQMRSVVARE